MDENTISFVAMCFRAACNGEKLSDSYRAKLQAMLDRMNEPERAGIIGAIIRILLEN